MSGPQDPARLELPDLEEEYGEEAVHDAVSTLHRDHVGEIRYKIHDDTIMARIRGIDFIDRIHVFAAIENRMRAREEVLEALRERREELEKIGERDERLQDVDVQTTSIVDDDQDEEHEKV